MKNIKTISLKIATLLVLSVGLVAPFVGVNAYATSGSSSSATVKSNITEGFKAAGGTGSEDLKVSIQTIINTMLFIVGILAVAMIIYSGIKYITAAGDKTKIGTAKDTLVYSIVGLVVAIVAYAIVNFVFSRFK